MKNIQVKNRPLIFMLGIIAVFIGSVIVVLFFSPVDREFRRLQNDVVFQAFEKQFPDAQKQKLGFNRYTIEYHAQSKDSKVVLGKNNHDAVYFYCDGLTTNETKPIEVISVEEFRSLISADAVCVSNTYQAWEIK